MKMTITDQMKILNKSIFQNEVQYDLDRKAAIISARSSKTLDKVECLTGEYFGLKPNTIEQARFGSSPLGKIFNKGLDKDDKKEGLFKRLENIKDKNKEQLQVIKDQGEKQLKELKNIDKNKRQKQLIKLAKKMIKQINYCLNLKKQMRQLIMQNSFEQKIMGLNITLIVFHVH